MHEKEMISKIKKITVLTIVHNRSAALNNLIKGLSHSKLFPEELIIIHINENTSQVMECPFKVRQFSVNQSGRLNIAAARNTAISYSSTEWNIFLDVDCIPSPNLISTYVKYFKQGSFLYSGQVRYLTKNAMHTLDFNSCLMEQSVPDEVRKEGKNHSFELFWSLNFGCSKTVFNRIGGFDPLFTGYGGEDTDFSFSARNQKIVLITVPAYAFHQYHLSYSPPLNHLEDIVVNSILFHQKWGVWPMRGWLDDFIKNGFVKWVDNHPSIIKLPTLEQLKAHIKE